jgi:hypothetical protein
MFTVTMHDCQLSQLSFLFDGAKVEIVAWRKHANTDGIKKTHDEL